MKELLYYIIKRNSYNIINSYNTNNRLWLYKDRKKIVMAYMWLYFLLDMGS